jgi:Uma2 family endonuclease
MVMPEVVRRWTRQEVLVLPEDGNRYELFDGELLVTPAPSLRHQHAVTRLWERLQPFVARYNLGVILTSPADLSLGGDHLSQPDLFVLPDLPASRSWADTASPLLVIEVLSPATARYDRLVKRVRFQRAGIGEYWIVDLDAHVVERWRPEDERPEILAETLVWMPRGTEPGLTIDLLDLFKEL